jgi:hypothetical protein
LGNAATRCWNHCRCKIVAAELGGGRGGVDRILRQRPNDLRVARTKNARGCIIASRRVVYRLQNPSVAFQGVCEAK